MHGYIARWPMRGVKTSVSYLFLGRFSKPCATISHTRKHRQHNARLGIAFFTHRNEDVKGDLVTGYPVAVLKHNTRAEKAQHYPENGARQDGGFSSRVVTSERAQLVEDVTTRYVKYALSTP